MSLLAGNEELRKMGFIYEATEPTSESIADIPKNRALLVAELQNTPPTRPEIQYELETVEAVFEHYQPSCRVEFQNEKGESLNETLQFHNLGDFGPKGITAQSRFLKELEEQEGDYLAFARKLRSNKTLQNLLADPAKKEAYLTILQVMLDELNEHAD